MTIQKPQWCTCPNGFLHTKNVPCVTVDQITEVAPEVLAKMKELLVSSD